MKRFLTILLFVSSFIIGVAQDKELLTNDSIRYQDANLSQQVISIVSQMLKDMNEDDMDETKAAFISLMVFADSFADLQDYTTAITLGTQALEIHKRKLGEKSPDYATALDKLAGYYLYLGDYNKAIELGTQAAEFFKREPGDNPFNYVSLLGKLSVCFSYLGNYPKAVELGTQAAEIFKRELGENDSNYVNSLDNLAGYYSHLGDYNKAIELGMQALEIYKRVFGENSSNYATSLNNLAVYYSYYGDNAKAIELGSQALEIRKRVLGENAPDYATSLNVLAGSYSNLGDYNKAVELGMKAVEIHKRDPGENSSDYATSLNNLAGNYFHLGDYSKAIELGTKAAEIFNRWLGENHPAYASSLENISVYLLSNSDYLMATSIFGDAIRIEQAFLTQMLSSLPSTYRFTYWNKYQNKFQDFYPYLSFLYSTNQLLSDCYDKSCLFAKGLLLSAETEMRNLILESGDMEAVNKFEQLSTTRAWLNNLYEKPIAERHVSTDSLENVAEKLEMELVQMSKTYGDFMHNLKLTWRDVQAKLGDKDVAVEFLSFPVFNSDSTMYIALTVQPGYDSPHMVKLFEENELKTVKSSCYSNSKLSELIWGKLSDELDGVENIYFSPCGELYNIAIESMPHWEQNCMMSDKFNIYRLSSTRELAMTCDETQSNGAVVYGGIKYDTDVANMGALKNESETIYAFRGFDPDSANCRGTNYRYLPETLVEVNDIVTVLRNSNVPVDSMTGVAATESSFKDLSGQKKRLLHISTHGFYWSETTAAKRRKETDKLRFLHMGDDYPRYVEDKSMTRSGLLFAGAQNTLNGVEIPAGVEDGVLTAQEIAQLDLRGLDLLLLSACQTGLGEIKGDGVFGLQRGFKKAGARSILMSLWEVDDLSTRLFMSEFYRYYLSGKSKQVSFKLAQKFIREYKDENGTLLFDKPSYWAAFILLDALD